VPTFKCSALLEALMNKKLEDYSKEELLELVKGLRSRKKFGLVWEDKPEEVVQLCQTELPVLEEAPNKAVQLIKGESANLIIEGDNYHALSALNYTHAGKIDVIYIDPPYNTGNKSWKYNNNYVERDDTFKHSKFASFIHKRLRLAKELLRDDGILLCAIDDYEVHCVRLILDEVFGEENRLGTLVVVHNPGGRQDEQFFATSHEYTLVYARNSKLAKIGRLDISEEKHNQYKHKDEHGTYKVRDYRRSGANSRRKDRPNLWYPIYFNEETESLSINKDTNTVEIWPIDPQGIERVWRWNATTFMEKKDKYILVKRNSKNIGLYVKERLDDNAGEKPKTTWIKPAYSAVNGTTTLKQLLPAIYENGTVFEYPKSPALIQDLLKVTTKADSLVLDFFAGSGTTGQAVLELNKEDSGNRQFILCTNNENGIAETITYPRIRRVVEGYGDTKGIPANIRYLKTSLVSRQKTDDQTRIELVARSADMICLRENTFEKVIETKLFKIFCNQDHYSAILFDADAIVLLKDALAKLEDGKPVHIYIFSLSNDTYEDDFAGLNRPHELRPIPESILEVYRRIFSGGVKNTEAQHA
jgi:adenine-specific DNA-methyltransferase